MNYIYSILLTIGFIFIHNSPTYSQTYKITGTIIDAETQEPLDAVIIQISSTPPQGTISDEKGHFSLNNTSPEPSTLTFSCLGYTTTQIRINPQQSYNLQIELHPEAIAMDEVVVTQKQKQKYSKKNNPAVELIRQAIANKDNNYIDIAQYSQMFAYERMIFALKNLNTQKGLLRKEKFIGKYMETSPLDGEQILPYSVRETFYELYRRNNPPETKKIILGQNKQGFDNKSENTRIEKFMDESFPNIDIRQNEIQMFLRPIVSPLHENLSIHFYRWYIRDTLTIDNERYIQLEFLPFNTRDLGFSGHITIKDDSSKAIKNLLLRVPKKANLNFVKAIQIEQTFRQIPGTSLWAPEEYTTMVNLSFFDIGNFYLQRNNNFKNIIIDRQNDIYFATSAPVVRLKTTQEDIQQLQAKHRPTNLQDYAKLDSMMNRLEKNKLIRMALKGAKVVQSGYVPEKWEPGKNLLNIGALPTLYGYNQVEKHRFQLTFSTTPNLHRHLFLFGYAAYGTGDKKLKYSAEATWALNPRKKFENEFPMNNISIGYTQDIRMLGQESLQQSYDNILQSFKIIDQGSYTYQQLFKAQYTKEWYNGFSISTAIKINKQELPPPGPRHDHIPAKTAHMSHLNSTEADITLRYARNEKYTQMIRYRRRIPSEATIITLQNRRGLHGILGGEHSYHHTGIHIQKDFWIPSIGKIFTIVKADKLWGKNIPFPILLTPSANNSYTKQYGTFDLLIPFEFVNDKQASLDIEYHMGGIILNRIPLLNTLRWREVLGIKALIGELSNRNNPQHNPTTFTFPYRTYPMTGTPYIEYNIGIENILSVLHINYIRRISYLHHQNIKKHGFKVGLTIGF